MAKNYRQQLVDLFVDLSGIEIKAPEVQAPQVTNVSDVISTQVLEELKKSFGEIDAPTQKFIQDLIDLELKLQAVKQTQAELDKAFSEGKISEQEYAETSSYIVAAISSIHEETVKLTDKQKEYQAALQSLKDTYNSLSEAQRNSPEGEALVKNITSLKAEIDSLNPEKLSATKDNVVSIRTELQQLTELMARNPDSPLFEGWKTRAAELKISLKEVKTDIDQATNSTAGIDAFASGLRGLVGAFTAVTGVVGLFTDDTDELGRVTKNAASFLALLNGVQEVSNVLSKESKLNVYLLGLMRKQNTIATTAETVAESANTVSTEANTGAKVVNTAATEGAAIAERGLAAAMMANPAGLVIGGIAALAAAYLLLSNSSDEAAKNHKRLAEEAKNVSEGLNAQRSKIEPLVDAVKRGNLTHEQQLNIYKQLKDINPELVKGIDAQAISIDKLTLNTKSCLSTLEGRLRLESKENSFKEGLDREDELQRKVDEQKDRLAKYKDETSKYLLEKYTDELEARQKINNGIREEIGLIIDKTSKISQAAETEKKDPRSVDAINADIALQKKLQSGYAETTKQWNILQSNIDRLEAEKRKITGETDKSKKSVTGENKLLNEQQSLLEAIANLKKHSD